VAQCEGLERARERKRKLSNCRSRNSKAVFKVDGHLFCLSCAEQYFETHFIDQCRVVRLSDNDKDFHDLSRAATARVASA
jgi:hypothetical protein